VEEQAEGAVEGEVEGDVEGAVEGAGAVGQWGGQSQLPREGWTWRWWKARVK